MERMPIWACLKSDPIRFHWLLWLLCVNTAYGTWKLFGDTPAFWCGLTLLASTGLVAFGWSLHGAIPALLVCSILLFVTLAGITPGAPTPVADLILAAASMGWHVLVIYDVGAGYDAARDVKQRAADGG